MRTGSFSIEYIQQDWRLALQRYIMNYMVAESRVQDGSFPIPKLLIGKEDISQFIEEFRGFHAQFAGCFSREEPRKNFFQ